MHTFARTNLVKTLPFHDAVCFCFGEIDCRAHAHTHGQENLARDYIDKIRSLTPNSPIVMSVLPPERNPAPVHNGTAQERLRYVQQLNDQIRHYCTLHRVAYLNVYTRYADPEGFMRADLMGRRGHIGDPSPLKEEILELIKENLV